MLKKSLKLGNAFMVLALIAAMMFSSKVSVYAADTQAPATSYRTVTEVFDWGAAVTKVIVDLGKTVSKDSVSADTFKVHVVRSENRQDTIILGAAEGDRTVTKAYVSDKDGNATTNGNYATLEMEVGPDIALGSPLNYSLGTSMNAWINCEYTITQQKDIVSGSATVSGIVANVFSGDSKKLVDDFIVSSGTYDNITLTYASYAPAKDSAKHPLIIWLHGMGEGGSDGLLPITANKADNFASKDIQAYFDGAYVLVPQAPTFWMDGFQSFGDGTSKYENALMALIKDYVSNNKDIDTNRIYIGGDSNGGYMTMLMARDYTDYFAAAFPTCEALKDTLISDAEIQRMKNLPIWFTAAKTDTIVLPADYVVATYDRLDKAGAKNIHFSFFDNVVDTTGLYKKADGTPYEYMGHFSWIYVYNNQCTDTINGKTTTIMEWLAAQTKATSTSYSTVTEVFDWGAATTKVIVDLGKTVAQKSILLDTFKVHVVRTENRPNTIILGASVGERKVTKAYVSDKNGIATANGNYATLEMEVGPDVALSSPLNYGLSTGMNAWINCDYTITQQKDIVSGSATVSELVANVFSGDSKKLVDDFKVSSGTYDNITLTYASYAPAKDSAKHPLIIWLHGMGEGGSDGLLPITANKADNFASKDIQAYFDGAYVLVPQAPTFWMDGFQSFGDGTSKYENALMALIKDYVSNNKDIDTNRIYIGGDSNGGYMTMLMARDYTDYFAAAFPTCEALKDTLISDAEIQRMKNLPIWFTAAKTDTIVPPADYVVATYDRLDKAGAKNIHFSFFDNVVDTTGLYKKADGTPYEYMGHFSWIYVYNNQSTDTINGKTTTIMEWLAAQELNETSIPKTGDTAPIAQLMLLMALSMSGAYLTLRKKTIK